MRRALIKEQKKKKLSIVAAREIQNGNGKGASKSKRVQELDNLLSIEEVGDLVIGLNLMEDSSLVEKGSNKDEMGAQRNMCDTLINLDLKS